MKIKEKITINLSIFNDRNDDEYNESNSLSDYYYYST